MQQVKVSDTLLQTESEVGQYKLVPELGKTPFQNETSFDHWQTDRRLHLKRFEATKQPSVICRFFVVKHCLAYNCCC